MHSFHLARVPAHVTSATLICHLGEPTNMHNEVLPGVLRPIQPLCMLVGPGAPSS